MKCINDTLWQVSVRAMGLRWPSRPVHILFVFFIHNYHIYINIIVRSNSIENSSVSIGFFIAIDKIGWTSKDRHDVWEHFIRLSNVHVACLRLSIHVLIKWKPFSYLLFSSMFYNRAVILNAKKKKKINLQLRQDNKILKVKEENRIYYTFGFQCFFLYKSSLNWFVTDFFLSPFWCYINYSSQ